MVLSDHLIRLIPTNQSQADQSKDQLATLVSKTVEYVQARHTPDERVGSREATYERDTVEGPLGSDNPDTRE